MNVKIAKLLKRFIIPVLKLIVAAGLVYWLIHTKKITLAPFVRMVEIPWLVPFVFIVVLVMIILNNYRWLLLLRGQRIESSVGQTLPLTFIGLFFNLAMPGSVGGDVIKAFYIAKEQPGTKLRAATSVLMDRVVGLYAMTMLAIASVLTHWNEIMHAPHLRALCYMIFALFMGFTVFFMISYSRRIRRHDITELVLNKLPLSHIWTRLYDAIHSFRTGRRQFLFGVLLSVFVQFLFIAAMYIVAKKLDYQDISLGAFLFIVPVGLIATAVPLSPAGVGVGQAVFLALFTWYQGAESDLGPLIITIQQVVLACWGLLGALLYFTRKVPVPPEVLEAN